MVLGDQEAYAADRGYRFVSLEKVVLLSTLIKDAVYTVWIFI